MHAYAARWQQRATFTCLDGAALPSPTCCPFPPRIYHLSNPQFVRNVQKCGAAASLGQGTIVLRALPGFEGTFPDSASVTRFQTSEIQSSPCGDELTIWGWMLGERKRTPAEIARLSGFYSSNPTVLSFPVGMEVTVIIEGSLNTTSATTSSEATTLPSAFYPEAPTSSRRRLHDAAAVAAADTDCSSAFSGGPKDAVEEGAKVALKVISLLPGIGEVADVMSTLGDFLAPSALISGRSVYDCIAGFVEAAIDAKISAYDLNKVRSMKAGSVISGKNNQIIIYQLTS